jgi:hypothetical protein
VFDGQLWCHMLKRIPALTAWALAIAVGFLAATEAWHAETRSWRCCSDGVPLTPYYLLVFSWTPLVALAWVAAGAVLLARFQRYRGFWYWTPQILITLLMVVRLGALAYEGGFPDASQVAPENMRLVRYLLVAVGGASFVLSCVAAVGCGIAALAHTNQRRV